MFDGKAFGQEVVAALKAHVDKSLAPLLDRLDALEKRLDELPAPIEVDEQAIVSRASQAIESELAALAEDMGNLRSLVAANELPDISAAVSEAVAAMLKPEYGAPVGAERVKQMVEEAISDARDQDVAQIQAWMDGVDERFASLPDLSDAIAEEVGKAIDAIPAPQDGKSVTVEELSPMVQDAVQKAVVAIPAPKDGCGIKELLIDREGALVATMDDGRVKSLGVVVGKDGADADMGAIERSIAEKVAAIPAPKDGFGFDDMDLVMADDGVALVFSRGDEKKAFVLPVVIDCGVYKQGREYRKGNAVTWGGSLWIAQKDEPQGKPDSPDSDWRLAVKKGQNGKAA